MRIEDYALEELRGDVVLGLLYVHHQLGANTGKALEASSFLYALTELLIERGVITEKELNERKIVVAKRLTEKFREMGMGAGYGRTVRFHAVRMTAGMTSESGLILRRGLSIRSCRRSLKEEMRRRVELNEGTKD